MNVHSLVHYDELVAVRAQAAPFAAEASGFDADGLTHARLEPRAVPATRKPACPCNRTDRSQSFITALAHWTEVH